MADLKSKYGINDRKSVEAFLLTLLSLTKGETFESLLATVTRIDTYSFQIMPKSTEEQSDTAVLVNVHDARNVIFLPQDLE